MKFEYRPIRLSSDNKLRLSQINNIIEEYQAEGYRLTLRQLYYQLVSRDFIPNKSSEYDKLGQLLKEGRMGGVVDWDAIEDRLRKPSTPASFESPEDILIAAANQFALPRMKGQECYVEVWVEKDALSGVLSRVTYPYHIPILVNRGYSSASAMHDSYQRFQKAFIWGAKRIRILYLGDFDPSGVDMLRDVDQRIREFFLGYNGAFEKWEVNRGGKKMKLVRCPEMWEMVCKEHLDIDFGIISVALTREQINQYVPPPNPAKRTDSRFAKFNSEHGDTSWEVDALKPEVLNEILTKAIESEIDYQLYSSVLEKEVAGRAQLRNLKKYLNDGRIGRRRK